MTQADSATRNSAPGIVAVTLLLSISYAVLRYHVAGSVPWTDFPFHILDKALCLAPSSC